MALEHDSRKIEKEQDKAKYAEEKTEKNDDRIGQRRNMMNAICLDLQIFEAPIALK